jgi:hypothetical protein
VDAEVGVDGMLVVTAPSIATTNSKAFPACRGWQSRHISCRGIPPVLVADHM